MSHMTWCCWSHDLVTVSHDHGGCHVIPAGITGNPNVGFSALDLEGDFDPASYDQTMARAFDDDYYLMEEEEGAEDRGGEGGDEGKPVFSDDEEGGKSPPPPLSLPSFSLLMATILFVCWKEVVKSMAQQFFCVVCCHKMPEK